MDGDGNRIAATETLDSEKSSASDSVVSRKKMSASNPAPTVRRHPQYSGATESKSSPTNSKAIPKTSTATTTPTTGTSVTTSFLLRLLIREIQRDGGACLVTTLKEYIIADHGLREPLRMKPSSHTSSSSATTPYSSQKSSKKRNHQLNLLLSQSNIGKPKLLAFLESHPDIFCVDRTVIPHWVRLVTPIPKINDATFTTTMGTPCLEMSDELRSKVYQKALLVLRKRQARIDRRRKKSSNLASIEAGATASADDTNKNEDIGVYCHWLLHQCSWELHFYLRSSGFYMNHTLCGYETPSDVKQVGTREWEEVTLATFEKILCMETDVSEIGKYDNGRELKIGSLIHVQNSKAFLRQSSSEDRNNQRQQHDDASPRKNGIIAGESKCDGQSNGFDPDDTGLIHRIDQHLTDIVCRKDGGHQVTLSLILHRYPSFKELLGGRDLWKLYCDYSDPSKYAPNGNINNGDSEPIGADDSITNADNTYFFKGVTMFYDGPNLVLRSKRSKIINSSTSNDECKNGNESNEEKRMKVDEEGLYSVTNNKWGKAMSNILIRTCRQTNLYHETHFVTQADENSSEELAGVHSEMNFPKIVVDLTASVGGLTLALARSNFFDRVIALEIDEVRATLCRENMDRYGFYSDSDDNDGKAIHCGRSVVEVRHQDSVQQIPFLPRRSCFVIDPPWGGWDYKGKVHRQQLLKLGDVPLQDVLVKISHHNAPCVVGLRLPTNFGVQEFLSVLAEREEESIDFECLTVRKIAVQLFVVLFFPSTES